MRWGGGIRVEGWKMSNGREAEPLGLSNAGPFTENLVNPHTMPSAVTEPPHLIPPQP